MHHFTDIAALFMLFFEKKLLFHWTYTEKYAMHSLCTALCYYFILDLPDFTQPFLIESDASNTTVGGVLTQEHTFFYKPIAFLRKALTSND